MRGAAVLVVVLVLLHAGARGRPLSHLFLSPEHRSDSLLVRFLHEFSQGRHQSGAGFYPPVLPIREMTAHGQERRFPCSSNKLASSLEGRWHYFRAWSKSQSAPANSSSPATVFPLLEPAYDCCLLAKPLPTLVDATALRGKSVYFLGDSHMRYIYNYFLDFLEGPCNASVYAFADTSHVLSNSTISQSTSTSSNSTHTSNSNNSSSDVGTSSPFSLHLDDAHRDNGYELQNSCGGLRASASTSFERMSRVTLHGGIFPDARVKRNTSVDARFVWAPRQSPFASQDLLRTEECLKEFTIHSPNYLINQLGTTCKTWQSHLADILARNPLAVVIAISEIEIKMNTTQLIANFDIPEVHSAASKIILFNHKSLVKSKALAVSRALGLTHLDVTSITPPERLRDRVHLGGPAGAVASRALFWLLHGIAKDQKLKS